MNILALVEADEHVCCRYRIAAFRPHIEAAGHQLVVCALPKGFLTRWRELSKAGAADVVILQRKLLSRVEVAWLRRKARRLVFDFDDAIWLRDSHSGKGFHDAKRIGRFRAIVRAADLLVAGNSILAAHARRVGDPSRVVEIPTCIDIAKYIPIGKSIPGLRFKVICDRFPQFERLPVDAVAWNAATEACELASADIGIAWVPDDSWSRGKCALKVLQYHAAGLPVVANPVGVQSEIVRPAVNGFLASTKEDWVAAIRGLAADAQCRHRLGMAGREQVCKDYSIDVGGAMWVEVLRRLEPAQC